MIIENAERLGLAQLHQLRGRVGRGAKRSACLMMYDGPLTEAARARLEVLRKTTDGFEIAKRDLEIRGPGDLLGTRQTGLAQLRIADLVRDRTLLPGVEQAASELLAGHEAHVAPLIRRWVGGRGGLWRRLTRDAPEPPDGGMPDGSGLRTHPAHAVSGPPDVGGPRPLPRRTELEPPRGPNGAGHEGAHRPVRAADARAQADRLAAAPVADPVGAVDRRRGRARRRDRARVRGRGVRHALGRMRHQRLRGPPDRPARAAHEGPAHRERQGEAGRGARAVLRAVPRGARARAHPERAHGGALFRGRGARRGLPVHEAVDASATDPSRRRVRVGDPDGVRRAHRRNAAARVAAARGSRGLGLGLRHDVRDGGPRGRSAHRSQIDRDPVRQRRPRLRRREPARGARRPPPRRPRGGSRRLLQLRGWRWVRRCSSTSST